MLRKKITVGRIGEFGLIHRLSRTINVDKKRVIKGIGDDAAVILPPGAGKDSNLLQLFTTDMLIEDIHFKRSMGAFFIGRKAMACNISDIVAMGGLPSCAVISLGVSPGTGVRFVEEIYRGIDVMAYVHRVSVVGGDTVKSKKIIINVAMLGEVSRNNLVTRSGAKRGDKIFVSGPLGRSLRTGHHLYFTPRIHQAQYLVKTHKPTAMIDVSDGLAGDLNHILESSGVGANLYATQIPRRKGATLSEALYDGEDFELLFTVSPQSSVSLMAVKEYLEFSYIGDIVEKKKGYHLLDGRGKRIPFLKAGFTHF